MIFDKHQSKAVSHWVQGGVGRSSAPDDKMKIIWYFHNIWWYLMIFDDIWWYLIIFGQRQWVTGCKGGWGGPVHLVTWWRLFDDIWWHFSQFLVIFDNRWSKAVSHSWCKGGWGGPVHLVAAEDRSVVAWLPLWKQYKIFDKCLANIGQTILDWISNFSLHNSKWTWWCVRTAQ